MPNILEIHNLTKYYQQSGLWRSQRIMGVEQLNLNVREGEIFGLLGLNGSGKTTTLKLILGLLFPTVGEIILNQIKMPNPKAVHQVGFVPEMPYFPKHLSVEEVIKFYGSLSGVDSKELQMRCEKVLERVRMSAHRKKRIRECSKGMLQRLSLAQALIHDPKFLILDEPITGLDPLGLAEMRELILSLNREGKTILFSSHMIAEVERIAHRAAILLEGRLARMVESSEWEKTAGHLEKIFVDTVSPDTKIAVY